MTNPNHYRCICGNYHAADAEYRPARGMRQDMVRIWCGGIDRKTGKPRGWVYVRARHHEKVQGVIWLH